MQRSHFRPPTPGLHSHWPVSGLQVSATLPSLLHPQRLGHPAASGPKAAVLPSGQQPCQESEHFCTCIPGAVEERDNNRFVKCGPEHRFHILFCGTFLAASSKSHCLMTVAHYRTIPTLGTTATVVFTTIGIYQWGIPVARSDFHACFRNIHVIEIGRGENHSERWRTTDSKTSKTPWEFRDFNPLYGISGTSRESRDFKGLCGTSREFRDFKGLDETSGIYKDFERLHGTLGTSYELRDFKGLRGTSMEFRDFRGLLRLKTLLYTGF